MSNNASKYDEDFQDQVAFEACLDVSSKNGFRYDDARTCRNNELGCVGCPFYDPSSVETNKEWFIISRRINPPKLFFIERQLRLAKIPHNTYIPSPVEAVLDSDAPILRVCSTKVKEAQSIIDAMKKLPDNHEVFKMVLDFDYAKGDF